MAVSSQRKAAWTSSPCFAPSSALYGLDALYVPNAIFSRFLESATTIMVLLAFPFFASSPFLLFYFPIDSGLSYVCVLIALAVGWLILFCHPPPGMRVHVYSLTTYNTYYRKNIYINIYIYIYISRTSAVSSTNFGSILISASCVVGTCNILCG